jgi:hypothetical protein
LDLSKFVSKFENFSTYLVDLTLVIVIQNFKSFDIEKSLVAFSYAFGGLLVLCTLIALPLDFIIIRQDKTMCNEIGVDYENEFFSLVKADRQTLRKKYNK